MSKQSSRQASKQGQNANKQSNNQSSKQSSPTNKQTTTVAAKQNRPGDKPPTRQAIKQERREEEKRRRQEEKRRAVRRKRILIGSLVAAVVLVAAVSIFAFANAQKPASQNQATPTEQVVNPAYPPVNGIYCDSLEQTAYHIHAHLTIYINGNQVAVPQGVGIAPDQSCLYWLHTHSSDGVLHIEAPKKVSPTLGDFLGIWGQSFSQLGFHNELASTANWTVYVDGKQVTSNFNQLVLQAHMVITIAYNSPNIKPDTSYPWPQGE
jgi:hypothetical protein